MKKLFFVLALVLLVGCTLQENELDQVLLEMENMAGELSQLEGLASVQNFDGFKHRVISANASLEKINAWVSKAEERGEDPEVISRVRSDSGFLEAEFSTLVLMADLLKKLEDSRPLMEALKRKEVDKLDPAIAAVDEILGLIDKIKENIDKTDAAAAKAVDKDILDTKGALDKMYAFENEIDLRRNEFVSVKEQLEQVKENMGMM
ncbi:hypothetical protein KY338_06965 [Candidatus Woesearchaeota archaeon]|nr:hypothetical protein [Candidatus Woesearchaeota archaeon]MBW3006267.1 hypothetical protein [Candidatus Woesearchaeota archaeon]